MPLCRKGTAAARARSRIACGVCSWLTQVALSLLLLAGAGLLIKSFANLNATDPGLDPTRVLTADFVFPRGKYPEPEQQRQFFQRFLPQLAALPGVESIGRRVAAALLR